MVSKTVIRLVTEEAATSVQNANNRFSSPSGQLEPILSHSDNFSLSLKPLIYHMGEISIKYTHYSKRKNFNFHFTLHMLWKILRPLL